MSLRGGDHGIIANATNTCQHPQVASAKFIAQDNAVHKAQVPLRVKCGKSRQGRSGQ